jgi:two-component system phosphate regulon response regulator PhoB
MASTQDYDYLVIIVDDNPELLMSLTFALSNLPSPRFCIRTADNGIAGLEQVSEMQPHCVIIDVKMPGLEGPQLVRALRGDPATATIPLIILSAMVQEKDIQRGLYAGADEYLTKPITPEGLVAAILRTIALNANERAIRLQMLAEAES